MVTLRDYQLKAVEDLRRSFQTGSRAPLLCLPVAGGKTVIFSYIAIAAAAKGNRILILVHRQELLDQTSRHLFNLGIPHGVVAANRTMSPENIQVASVQTLARRLPRMPEWFAPSLIICDEAHHYAQGRTWPRILNHYFRARRLGVTASPIRLDGKGLGTHCGGFFDTIVYGPSVKDLIRDGWISQPHVYAPPVGADLTNMRTKFGDFDQDEAAERLDKPTITGCAVEHYNRICQGVPAIAFCASIKHAEHVAAKFDSAGIPSASIDGSLSDDVRRSRIEALSDGRIKVLTSCMIVSEGTDIPVVGAAILLRPTASLGMHIQQVGRAMRMYPGKTHCTVLDHVGNCLRLGLPDDDREWSLDGAKELKKKGAAPTVAKLRTCHRCYAIFKAYLGKCPQCGTNYELSQREIAEVQGELQRIYQQQETDRQARDKAQQVGMAKTYEQLVKLGKDRGYKKAEFWARIIMKAREGKHKKMGVA